MGKIEIEMPAGWTDNDTLIGCGLWVEPRFGCVPTVLGPLIFVYTPLNPAALKCECEMCHSAISAFPVSVEKAKRKEGQRKDVHLVCRSCMAEISRKHQVKFSGRIRDNKIL